MVVGLAVVVAGLGWVGVKRLLYQDPDNDLGLVSQSWLTEQRSGKQSDRFS